MIYPSAMPYRRDFLVTTRIFSRFKRNEPACNFNLSVAQTSHAPSGSDEDESEPDESESSDSEDEAAGQGTSPRVLAHADSCTRNALLFLDAMAMVCV